ncbi:hypothetical protein Dimus_010426 [Dionaea muscipula]
MAMLSRMQAWESRKKAAGFDDDLHSYEALISGYIKLNDFDNADRYYEEMLSSGIIPSICILENILDGLCMRENICKVKEYLKAIIEDGREVSISMAERLVHLYSRNGKIEELKELLQTLLASNSYSDVLSQVHCGIIRMHALADRLDDME